MHYELPSSRLTDGSTKKRTFVSCDGMMELRVETSDGACVGFELEYRKKTLSYVAKPTRPNHRYYYSKRTFSGRSPIGRAFPKSEWELMLALEFGGLEEPFRSTVLDVIQHFGEEPPPSPRRPRSVKKYSDDPLEDRTIDDALNGIM
jgi:hypothetical protein